MQNSWWEDVYDSWLVRFSPMLLPELRSVSTRIWVKMSGGLAEQA